MPHDVANSDREPFEGSEESAAVRRSFAYIHKTPRKGPRHFYCERENYVASKDSVLPPWWVRSVTPSASQLTVVALSKGNTCYDEQARHNVFQPPHVLLPTNN